MRGSGSGPCHRKNSYNGVFCLFCFSSQLITEGPMVLFQRKLYVSKAPGGTTPSRGRGPTFSGGGGGGLTTYSL